MLTTPDYMAYLKIAEGCDNCCSYCIIPQLRGSYTSRPYDEVMAEARSLAAHGTKELIVVAQDTTRYGEDLTGKLLCRSCCVISTSWRASSGSALCTCIPTTLRTI